MPLESAKYFIGATKDEFVGLSGGETLLYPSIEEVIVYGLIKGKQIAVATNGSIYKELPKETSLIISLPSLDEKTYRYITNRDLHLVIENIEKYKERGHRITLNCVVFKGNLSEVGSVAEYAYKNGFGLRLSPAVRTKRNNSFETITRSELEEIYKHVKININPLVVVDGEHHCDSCSLETIDMEGNSVECRVKGV